MTKEEIKARDKAIILDNGPARWPHFNILPVKKHDWTFDSDAPDALGFIVAADEARTTVYFGNIMAIPNGTILKQIRTMPHKTFPSLDALLDVYTVD